MWTNRELTKKGLASNPQAGFGCSKLTVPGRASFSKASTVFINPVMPDAASKCPTFPFTDPMVHGVLEFRSGPSASLIASISMGSPLRVPVPCAST